MGDPDRQDGGDDSGPHPNPSPRGRGYTEEGVVWRAVAGSGLCQVLGKPHGVELRHSYGALQFVAVLVLGATPFQMGVLVALGVAPSIVIGFFAGVIADRIRRRPILIVSELGRFALLASIPAAFLIGQLRIEQLYVVAFFNGVLTTFFDVANRSYLPTLVNRSELVGANSRLTASESFAEVTAFSMGGWIAQLSNSVAVAAIGGLTFLVSALSLTFIRKQEPDAEPS